MKLATHPITAFEMKGNFIHFQGHNYYLGYLEPVTYTIEGIMVSFLNGDIRIASQTSQDNRIFKTL